MKSEELSKKKFYQWLPEERRNFLEEEGIELSKIDSDTLTRLNTLRECSWSGSTSFGNFTEVNCQ